MKFVIYKVSNGYLLNVYLKEKSDSYIFSLKERMKMFAYIDKLMGEDLYDIEQTNEEDNP